MGAADLGLGWGSLLHTRRGWGGGAPMAPLGFIHGTEAFARAKHPYSRALLAGSLPAACRAPAEHLPRLPALNSLTPAEFRGG